VPEYFFVVSEYVFKHFRRLAETLVSVDLTLCRRSHQKGKRTFPTWSHFLSLKLRYKVPLRRGKAVPIVNPLRWSYPTQR
jgi:hypothetical protein